MSTPAAPAYTPLTVPADTDRWIWRYVTKIRGQGDVVTELTRIGIRQP